MEKQVRAKKHLGQHFLKDENIARKIADTLTLEGYDTVWKLARAWGCLLSF